MSFTRTMSLARLASCIPRSSGTLRLGILALQWSLIWSLSFRAYWYHTKYLIGMDCHRERGIKEEIFVFLDKVRALALSLQKRKTSRVVELAGKCISCCQNGWPTSPRRGGPCPSIPSTPIRCSKRLLRQARVGSISDTNVYFGIRVSVLSCSCARLRLQNQDLEHCAD